MTAYPLRLFGDPVLKERAREVEELDGDLLTLVDGMYETMYAEAGSGLAAPQIGVRRRIFTYDVGEGPTVVVNPVLVDASSEHSAFDEGCLSIPGLRFEVVRPERVTVRGIDLHGDEVVIEADEFLARVVQHELDHLDGVLVLDRVEPDVKRQALRELRTRDWLTVTPETGHRL